VRSGTNINEMRTLSALWQHSISRNKIIKLPELILTNQNKRHYHFRFDSVNQLTFRLSDFRGAQVAETVRKRVV